MTRLAVLAVLLGSALGALLSASGPASGQSAVRQPQRSQLIGPLRRGPNGQIEVVPGARQSARRRAPDSEPADDVTQVQDLDAEAGWIADPRTGCQVWNADPRPHESI